MANPINPESLPDPYDASSVCEQAFARAYALLADGDEQMVRIIAGKENVGILISHGLPLIISRDTLGEEDVEVAFEVTIMRRFSEAPEGDPEDPDSYVLRKMLALRPDPALPDRDTKAFFEYDRSGSLEPVAKELSDWLIRSIAEGEPMELEDSPRGY